MALHPRFPTSPYATLFPEQRWFPANEALRSTAYEKLLPPLVAKDTAKSPHKAIVSVLMLKEGWNVRNVTTIVGLRAYVAQSDILPEQTLGRGLRRMYFGNDVVRETVSVIGTPAFMDFVESIQSEGVTFERVPMGGGATRHDSLIVEVDTENEDKNLDDLENYLAVGFKLDYVKANGDLANYVPDFIVRTKDRKTWIVETKGHAELDLPQKMARLKQWCADATAAEEDGKQYDLVFVDQNSFEKHAPKTFASLAASFTDYKTS